MANKFNIGDKVRITANLDESHTDKLYGLVDEMYKLQGKEAFVDEVYKDGGVKIKEWYFHQDDLTLITPAAIEPATEEPFQGTITKEYEIHNWAVEKGNPPELTGQGKAISKEIQIREGAFLLPLHSDLIIEGKTVLIPHRNNKATYSRIFLKEMHPDYAEYIRRNCIETFDPENPIRLREYYERKAQEEQE